MTAPHAQPSGMDGTSASQAGKVDQDLRERHAGHSECSASIGAKNVSSNNMLPLADLHD